MNKQQLNSARRQNQEKHRTIIRHIRIWGGLLALLLSVYMLFAGKETFIDTWTIFWISMLPGLFIAVFTTKKIRDFFYNALCFAWLVGCLFLFTNQLRGTKPMQVKLSIRNRYTGRRGKYVVVELGTVSKSFDAGNTGDKLFNDARFLPLTISEGLWGYYYVVEKMPLMEN